MDIEENKKYIKEDFTGGIAEDNTPCPICGGTGEVTTMERVYPSEPHMAPVGTSKCECQLIEEDLYDSDIEH